MMALLEKMRDLAMDFRMVFVGDGDYLEEVKAMVRTHKLEEHCVFLGRQSHLEEIYPIFDVILLPSLFEGFPTVAVETQASGIPMLASSTITKEMDLGLNLVKFLPIDINEENLHLWVDAIREAKTITIPDAATRKSRLEEKKFTNQESAKLYLDFVEGKVEHYTL